MILQKLKLKNIRSYVSQEIELPQTSILLAGDIGCGKSSLLLAIEFALFGIVRGELHGESLLRKGTEEGSVELTFSIDNNEYEIHRVIKKSIRGIQQSSGYIIVNGLKTEGTPVELKAKILEIIGYPQNMLTKSLIYRYTVYTPQEEMKRIIFEQAEVRLDILRKVFNVDKYKQVKENTTIYLSALRDEINYYDAKLEEKNDKKKQKYGFDEELKIITVDIEKLTPEEAFVLEEKKKFVSQLSRLEEELKQKQVLNQHIGEGNIRKEVIEKKITDNRGRSQENLLKMEQLIVELEGKEFEEIDESQITVIKNDLFDIEEKNRLLEEKKQRWNVDLANLQAEHTSTQDRVGKNTTKLEELGKRRTGLEGEQSEVDESMLRELVTRKEREYELIEEKERDRRARKEAIESKIEETNLFISRLGNLDNCPTCFQVVNESHKQQVGLREKQKIESYESQLRSLIPANHDDSCL